MPFRYDTEEELKSRRSTSASRAGADNDTEIALGTRSLLAIFFGLVLICAVFFGLGYSVGRAGGSRAIAQASPQAASTAPDGHLSKPSADQTLTPVEEPPATRENGTPAPENPSPAMQSNTATPPPASPAPPVTTAQNQAPASPGAKPATLQPAAAASGSVMVQVAAVRVPQDAQILVEALKRHGYTAVVRNEPQDQLLHIQLGPFPSRSDAMAMRAKLLSDGYNAVVK